MHANLLFETYLSTRKSLKTHNPLQKVAAVYFNKNYMKKKTVYSRNNVMFTYFLVKQNIDCNVYNP